MSIYIDMNMFVKFYMNFETNMSKTWFKIVPKGGPKSVKNNKKTSWNTQDPVWVEPCTQWSPEWCQSGVPRPQNAWKIVPQDLGRSMNLNANLLKPIETVIAERKSTWRACPIDKHFNPVNLPIPSNLQISSQLLDRGASGRVETLRYYIFIYVYIYI